VKCPICEDQMKVMDRHGVEIDLCPNCKGVWLDRGELEKIVELVAQGGPAATDPAASGGPGNRRDDRSREDDVRRRRDDDDDDEGGQGSWFGRLFQALD
jgi:Zn-finger nucleic acid-binding protein